MALEIDYNICGNKVCEKIYFTDHTEAYDAVENPTGYDEAGAVANHPGTVSSLASATFAVITPSLGSYSFNVLSFGFPTIDTTTKYTINGTDIGYTDNKITDGVYTGTYTLVFDGGEAGTYTKTKYFFLTCQAECCIEKMYALVKDTCADCDSSKILAKAIEAEGFLKAAVSAFNCGKINLAKRLLAKVQYLCTNYNCKCC